MTFGVGSGDTELGGREGSAREEIWVPMVTSKVVEGVSGS